MAASASSFSFSSLLCEEDEASILKVGDENSGMDWINPCFVFDNEEEYIEILFKREMGFVSPSDDCSTSAAKWLKNARLDAIDWIFSTGAKFGFKFHTIYLSVTYFDRFLSRRSIDEGKDWAIQLLSMACLSLAAKMEEQNVSTLSEFPGKEYHFEIKVIKKMELLILDSLEWKMGSVTPFAYLQYLVKKFSLQSKPEAIISRAVDHIMAIVKDISSIDQRPSVIASAAILAASDATLTRQSVDLCVSSISWGSLERWENIVSIFNEKTGKTYDKKQMKNMLDILRKDFRTWDSLIKETGVSKDPITNKVLASNEWWQRKIQEHSSYKKFRYISLKFENEIRIIFKDAMASGEDIFSPSMTQPLTQQEHEEDVYRPTMDEEEGSGDSEDDMFGANPVASTGVTDELRSIGLTTSTPSTLNTDSGSRGKRKVGERSGQRKRQKVSASKQIADAVSVIADASKGRAAALNEINGLSVDAVMNELFAIDEVICDEDFRHRCIKLVLDKANREAFVAIAKRNKEFLLPWLRFMVYG